ncbi:uracil-DNA glycosylase family protein [Halogeometricum limi]|uniref:Uracil-DNA glycosylase n=1 Tax=Halogeometricum limi TaxID=555875 RepID=A0A1I6GUJ5_9EURY|nr:uracil-DNA glycosylase family protein [Halogeometricum limi]SFR45925.1 Uracil-DNA glycosylase [Halogeometricum limi]
MENVTDRTSNPFGMRPSCERFVPGYGDANAEFHVIGDYPGLHGGEVTGVPFTNEPSIRLQAALADAGLLTTTGDQPAVAKTFLSYLHMCVSEGTPTQAEYDDMERFFDAELRAIAAHVLLPVGARATEYVLQNYTAQARKITVDMEELHGREIRGSGFLVLPIANPHDWDQTHHDRLVDALKLLQSTDFRRETDLGRFTAGGDPYLVR